MGPVGVICDLTDTLKNLVLGVPWWPGILGFHCCGPGSIPDWGTEILQAVQHGQKMKKRNLIS